jgi:polysaccharide biosynthesis transport protein
MERLLDILRRRIRTFGITTVSVAFLAVIIALVIPAMYRSSAIILIEQSGIPSELVKSTITSFADQRIQVISQRVMTTSNLSDVLKKYDLYKDERETKTREEVMDVMRKDINLNMISADVIDPRSGRPTQATIAFKLTYDNRSPDLAQKVANELVTLYLNENLKSRTEQAAEATGFMDQEAAKLKEQINKYETELSDFKVKNSGKLPELTDLNFQLWERTDRELMEVDRQVRSLEDRKIDLEAQLEQLSPSATIYAESGERILTPQGRLKALETKYLSASSVYGEKHPDLIKMRREIAALQQEVGLSHRSAKELKQQLVGLKAKLTETQQKYTPDHPDVIRLGKEIHEIEANLAANQEDKTEQRETADNPAYIELKSRLDSTNADLKSLNENKRQYKDKLADYENRIVSTPKIERTYVALTRDYKNAVAKYQEMVAKQTSAKLAEELEKGSKGERFSLIEPPLTPEKPFKPNRKVLIVLGLMLALGAGFGVTMLKENMDKSIHGDGALQEIFGAIPLASIPYIVTDAERHKQKRRLTYSLGGAAASVIVAIVMVDLLFMPLDVLWYTVMRKLGL